MDIQKIKELALANGFSLKEQASGNMDLHSYVYEFANAIEQAAKAQAVPEGFVLVSQKDLLELTIAINAVDLATHTESKTNEVREMWQQVALKLMALGTAQEPAMTEITIRCTNCGLEFESDYDLEQNLIDLETGEIHDGCPTCKTDAYLMDLIKYPDAQEPNND